REGGRRKPPWKSQYPSAPKAPTAAPTSGNAQLARAMPVPPPRAECTSGSRVQKARLVPKSVIRALVAASPAIAFAPLKPLSVRVYSEMTRFASLDELRSACLDLPGGHREIAASVAAREATLTKPPGSLGRLETGEARPARLQGQDAP